MVKPDLAPRSLLDYSSADIHMRIHQSLSPPGASIFGLTCLPLPQKENQGEVPGSSPSFLACIELSTGKEGL